MGNTTIEINGKRYDARSGELLGDGTKPTVHHNVQRRGRAIDGMVKSTGAAIKPSAYTAGVNTNHQAVKTVATLSAKGGTVMEPVARKRRKPATAADRRLEKSKTLMRHAVKKPVIAKKTPIKTQSASEIAAAPVNALVPSLKKSAENVDERRMARAQRTGRSQHVRRFTTIQQNHPIARQRTAAAHTEVRRAPVTSAPVSAPRHTAGATGPGHNTAHTTQPQHTQHHTPRNADLFEAAIANAKAHEQPQHKPKRKTSSKILNITAGLAAFLVLAGFVGYLNMSAIEVRVASVRAGFSAQLPDYAPTGYAREGGIKAQQGVVAATYRSGSSSYTLQQQTSDWDSQTLYDNVVAVSDEKSETVSGQGRTVYIYGSKAAWVDGGVLYSMQTAGDISKDEILSIATSM